MVPAALLVVSIPLVGALLAYLLRRWQGIEIGVAALACAGVIALLAQPPDSKIMLPGALVGIELSAPFEVLGRVLRVRATERVSILLLFICAAALFVMSWRALQGRLFVPIGLIVLAAASLALMIRPFVYAALAFEGAAALAALMIQAERGGERSTLGALRYLSATTLALPMFLFAGWAIDRAGVVNLNDATALAAAYGPATVLLIGGFGLMIGAMPLYTWVHPVARDASPLVTAFIVAVVAGALSFLWLDFWQAYPWLRVGGQAADALAVGGIVLLIFGGALAWAQNAFARVLACAILVEIGCALLVLSRGSQLAVEALAFATLTRALSLGVFGLGIWRLRALRSSDAFADVRGARDLWAALALGVGGLSLAGFPGTPGFVSRWSAARAYGVADVEGLALLLAASASVGVGVVRGLIAVFNAPCVEVIAEGPADAQSGSPSAARVLAIGSLGAVVRAAADASPVSDDPLLLEGETLIEGEVLRDVQQPIFMSRDSFIARLMIGLGVAALIILAIWPGIIAPLAKAAAAQYTFYP
ncbi:MAG: hypothetical protein D6709_06010 [Chloroflexi bacterium]|uniref:NADH:quinone oxidoreductase/Mrp antiporter transmembrane domain-containing protein n=1 Tax=Candidatus Thermofonsia Clade 3 bacterium TaxID=2364212 RepID=A0A2M8QCF5_9CHLR|nr:MAG: hypothetical protein CUN48_08455 [Candidatus Thermofonsia Clade 3 bacterium]RMG64278.1 MAG: hypothetical protein D6709_06010 [Chloroflexota bacterium]